ncbi:hypothetical protein AZ006_005004 [Citrobacter freundii]|nr:hypothetical protein AZ006_005004 [Citrobacter freundii]
MLLLTVLIGTTKYFVMYHHKHNIEVKLTKLVPMIITRGAENIISKKIQSDRRNEQK